SSDQVYDGVRLDATLVTVAAPSPAGELSLRDAINLANVLTPAGSASVTAIDFDSTALSNQIITLSGVELPQITGNVTILGQDATNLGVSGNGQSRVFDIASGADASIQNLAITAGNGAAWSGGPVGNGGAILNAGTLTVSGCTFTGDSTRAAGGGI